MAAAWPRPMAVLLLALLAAAAGLLHPVDTQALQCHAVGEIGEGNMIIPLDEQATKSIRFSFPEGRQWRADYGLGEGSAEKFRSRFILSIVKTSPKVSLSRIKVTTAGPSMTSLLNTRVDTTWLEGEGQATLYFGEATLNIAFLNGDSKFLMQLSKPELAGLSAVQVGRSGQVEKCEGPGSVPETTIMTTPMTTTTTATTTEPATTITTTDPTTTTTTTTTTEPATTIKCATTTPVAETSSTTLITESSALTTEATYNGTTSEDGLTPACMPTGNHGTVACSAASKDPVPAVGGVQCVPWWAWTCAGLAVVFFVFIVGLIIYSITLYKRSFRYGKAMQASGGFGMTAQDMHYYEMRNNNLMIGNTIPRIVTPRPSSLPGLTPSHSTTRLSHSLSPSRTTTPFPFLHQNTDLEDSKNPTAHPKEKSRSSKVSFAED